MMARSAEGSGTNALCGGRAQEFRAETTGRAEPAVVYATLADLQSHLEWAGQRRSKKTRLLTVEAPAGPAVRGTEFVTTGADPMGSFSDHSVVTEATPGRAFEFVTEARLTLKRGGEPVEWTNVHRYEIAPEGNGSRVAYTIRIARLSSLPGGLRLLATPFAWILRMVWNTMMRRGLRTLVKVAEERANG